MNLQPFVRKTSSIYVPDDRLDLIEDDLNTRIGMQKDVRQGVLNMLPIDLEAPRSLPRNPALMRKARQQELLLYPDETRYTHHPRTRKTDYYRGEVDYIDHIISTFAEERSLNLEPAQILTGTSGAQELISSILERWLIEAYRFFASTELTSALTNEFITSIMERMNEDVQPIPSKDGCAGIDVKEACEYLEDGNIALFLSRTGSTPDGSSISLEDIKKMAVVAQKVGSVILLDETSSNLYHKEESKEAYTCLQPFIDDGTLTLVFGAELEGGFVGPAYAISSKKNIDDVFQNITNRRQGPILSLQRQQVLLETMPQNVLGDTVGFKKFLKETIRPHLALNFALLKEIFEGTAVELSTKDVTHGYQVCVLLPFDVKEKDVEAFFKKLAAIGVKTASFEDYIVDSVNHGFVLPFGKLSPEECIVTGHLIVEAFDQTWPE